MCYPRACTADLATMLLIVWSLLNTTRARNLLAWSKAKVTIQTSNITTEPCEQILTDLICWSHAMSKNSMFAWFYLNSYIRITTLFLLELATNISSRLEVIWKHHVFMHLYRLVLEQNWLQVTSLSLWVLVRKLWVVKQVYSIIN